ncbi:hypothetical protein MHYP_G00036100 [Metynnis hypsauchen]
MALLRRRTGELVPGGEACHKLPQLVPSPLGIGCCSRPLVTEAALFLASYFTSNSLVIVTGLISCTETDRATAVLAHKPASRNSQPF